MTVAPCRARARARARAAAQGWLGAPEGLETVAPRAVLGGARSPVLVDPMCGSGTFLIEGCARRCVVCLSR